VPIPTSATTIDLVTPEAFLEGPSHIGGGQHERRGQIIVKGFAFNMVTGGAETVSLIGHDNPWISDGSVVDDPVYEFRAGASGQFQQSVSECHLPLGPTQTRPNYSTATAQGATLSLTTSAGNVTEGYITVWGIYTSDISDRQADTSSPTTY